MTRTLGNFRFGRSLVAATFMLATLSCSSDDDGASSGGQQQPPAVAYPRQVEIEYKVTSTSGLSEADVLYKNESGGNATIDKAPLPFSKKFTRTVKQYDGLGLSATSRVGGSLDAEILVDGKSVEKKTFEGTSNASGSTVYIFP